MNFDGYSDFIYYYYCEMSRINQFPCQTPRGIWFFLSALMLNPLVAPHAIKEPLDFFNEFMISEETQQRFGALNSKLFRVGPKKDKI